MELKELWKMVENKEIKEWMKVCWFLQHTFNKLLEKKTSNKIKAHKKEGEWKEGQKANDMKEKRTERK